MRPIGQLVNTTDEPAAGELVPHSATGRPEEEVLTLARYADLIQAAWGLSDSEFEDALRLPPGAVRQWRNHDFCFAPLTLARLQRLFVFHEKLRFISLGHPPNFRQVIRRELPASSGVGCRSILAVIRSGDDAMMETVERALYNGF